jgi:hypothetical protein
VFEGGGVEDDFWFAFVEELEDYFGVADVGEDEVWGCRGGRGLRWRVVRRGGLIRLGRAS